MCAYAMLLGKVKHVFFGARNDRFGGCGSVLPIHQELHGLNCTDGVMATEAVQLLRDFYEGENPNSACSGPPAA
jgi:tRNA-specific adenosine deaminase 2